MASTVMAATSVANLAKLSLSANHSERLPVPPLCTGPQLLQPSKSSLAGRLRCGSGNQGFRLVLPKSPLQQRWRSSVIASATDDDANATEDDFPSDVNIEPEEETSTSGEMLTANVAVALADPVASPSVTTPPSSSSSSSSVADLKQALIDSLYGAERGLRASGETRGEVVELIAQLEALNPTPSPTDALTLLDGKWILAYTSFSELFPLLAAGNLPFVTVGEISQTIDASTFAVQNSVTFKTPLATTSLGATATFEVRSPKRVQIKFEESVIGTPQLTDSLELPKDVEVLGQRVDLSQLQGVLSPLQDVASSLIKSISGQPPLKIPIPGSDYASSWLLTTYLDEDLRISRGDGNSVFVLVKEGSPLHE